MDVKPVSSLLSNMVLSPELSLQEHGADRTTNPAQILTGVTGGLSLHWSWSEGLKQRPTINT